MATVVAVDVGGTAVKGEVLDLEGPSRVQVRVATPHAAGPDAVVDVVHEVVAELMAVADDALAVGVVVPGIVDGERGMASYSANLGWRDLPLRDLVSAQVRVPVVLDHDVRAAGVAEAALGRTAGVAHALVVTVGTGVAGAVTVHGRSVTGASGTAGEIGHLVVEPGGEPCPCGQRGCLERYASAAAIARRYTHRTGRPTDAREVAARLGLDPGADLVWAEGVQALATGVAAYTMLMDPEIVVVAGGLAAAGSALLEPLRLAVDDRMTWRPSPRIELSRLGGRAGVLGAAVLAARSVGHEPPPIWADPPPTA